MARTAVVSPEIIGGTVGDPGSVTVTVAGLEVGDRVAVNMPMRFDMGTFTPTYQITQLPIVTTDDATLEFKFPISGSEIILGPGSYIVPVAVIDAKGRFMQIPAHVVSSGL